MNDQVRIQEVEWEEFRKPLLQVRFLVFVDEQGVPPEMEEDEHDPAALHLLALDNRNQPVACGRVIFQGDSALIGRMAVLKPHRHQGIGTRLLQELLRQARQQGASDVQLHAQCEAEPFYRRLAFVPIGPVFEEAGIPHQTMIRELQKAGEK